jgi:hypothetical protein
VTEEAIKLAKDTDLIAGIVTVLHLHQLGMNVEGVGDGVPND